MCDQGLGPSREAAWTFPALTSHLFLWLLMRGALVELMIGSEEEMRQSWGRKLPGATWSRTRTCLNSIPAWPVSRDVSDPPLVSHSGAWQGGRLAGGRCAPMASQGGTPFGCPEPGLWFCLPSSLEAPLSTSPVTSIPHQYYWYGQVEMKLKPFPFGEKVCMPKCLNLASPLTQISPWTEVRKG